MSEWHGIGVTGDGGQEAAAERVKPHDTLLGKSGFVGRNNLGPRGNGSHRKRVRAMAASPQEAFRPGLHEEDTDMDARRTPRAVIWSRRLIRRARRNRLGSRNCIVSTGYQGGIAHGTECLAKTRSSLGQERNTCGNRAIVGRKHNSRERLSLKRGLLT